MDCRACFAIDEWHLCFWTLEKQQALLMSTHSSAKGADYTRSDKLHLFTWLSQTTFHACCLRERWRNKERERKGSESNHQSNRASAVIIWRAGFTLRRSVRVRRHLWMLRGCVFSPFKICSSRHDHLTSAKTLLSALSITHWGLVLTRTIIKPERFQDRYNKSLTWDATDPNISLSYLSYADWCVSNVK